MTIELNIFFFLFIEQNNWFHQHNYCKISK